MAQGGYAWWNIDYATGHDGWSVENLLDLYSGPTTPPVTPPVTPQAGHRYYTAEEVNAHYRTTDCWIIIGERSLTVAGSY